MPALPTGTVTFLFTDIEESSRLWSEHPDAMRKVVARHDKILRNAIDSKGGYVFATGGDAFSAAFQNTHDAVTAALDAQLAITDENWKQVAPKVRMGIHTGEADERDANYYGQVVNEASRLMSAGHGGQILISETARQIVDERLPDTTELVDLGELRLKDVDTTMRVFQVAHPGLVAKFPGLRGASAARNNLPSRLTSFVGRYDELDELQGIVDSSRLVTLTGTGGVGKTALAVEFARTELDSYPDGVWFVDLSPIEETMRVDATVASAIGVVDQVGESTIERLIDRLRHEQTLLILDNCEHVLGATASLTAQLLKSTDRARVLATSREPLGITGERPCSVPTLNAPAESTNSPDSLLEYPAVRLLVDRASVARPGFKLSKDNIDAVAAICRRLDGLPLALELAAARLNVLSADELLDRLEDRFGLLVRGESDRPERHQTLAATIDWSYGLLDEDEKALLNRLSVFAGGFTIDAAEKICAWNGLPAGPILDIVSSLVGKSLLVSDHGRVGRRFHLLETVHEYAAAKLAAALETDQQRHRYAASFRRLAVESFDELWGPDELAWLDRLEDEWPNIRRALAWHFDTRHTQSGLMMAGSLYRFALRRYHVPETLAYLERFIAADTTPGSARARALHAVGTLTDSAGVLDEAISLYREFGPADGLRLALNNAAVSVRNKGDWEDAGEILAELVQLARDSSDHMTLVFALANQATVALETGDDPTQSLALAHESLEFARESKSPAAVVQALIVVAELRRHTGDLEGAAAALREAQDLHAEYAPGAIEVLLGALALDRGDDERAVRHLGEHAALVRPHVESEPEGPLSGMAAALTFHRWAEIANRRQQYAIATTLLASESAWLETSAFVIYPTDQAEVDKTLREARGQLAPEAFDQAWDRGNAMTVPEALDFAVTELAATD